MTYPATYTTGYGMTGRGAWTSIGMPVDTTYYELLPKPPYIGQQSTVDLNHQAVTFGVWAIQRQLVKAGISLTPDGVFGPSTKDAVLAFQKKAWPTTSAEWDGIFGRGSAKKLFDGEISAEEKLYGIPDRLEHGIVMQESVVDPGAVGYTTPEDHGLVQINASAHPDISVAQAFDPPYALRFCASTLAAARLKYGRWDCAVASWNSPVDAATWAKTGTAPNQRIADYVNSVYKYAAQPW